MPLFKNLAVSEDVFANNRISLTLAEEDPVSSTIGHWTDECMKLGSSYLFESMIDPEFANSFDPSKSAFMYSLKDTLKPGTALFDWLPTQVRLFIYTPGLNLADLYHLSDA